MDVNIQETHFLSKQSWSTSGAVPALLTLGTYSVIVIGSLVVSGGSDVWNVYGTQERYIPVPKWSREKDVPTDLTRKTDTWVRLFRVSSEASLEKLTSVQTTVPEKLDYIRAQLGLSVSELAKIFSVDRQAIYGWLKSMYFTKDEKKLKKFTELYLVAQLSTQFLKEIPQNLSHQKVSGNMSLMDEFLFEDINIEKVTQIFKLLPLTQQEQRRAAMRSSSVRRELDRSGTSERKQNQGIDAVELLTGKRKIN